MTSDVLHGGVVAYIVAVQGVGGIALDVVAVDVVVVAIVVVRRGVGVAMVALEVTVVVVGGGVVAVALVGSRVESDLLHPNLNDGQAGRGLVTFVGNNAVSQSRLNCQQRT